MQKTNHEYQVLYQKYRPNLFKEVIGQSNVITMLSNSVKHQKVGNVYLFSGPHGVGKTTIARIFAKAINCLNPINGDACNQCVNCELINHNQTLELIEIDAASNNGVENVRNIIENCSYLPSQLKRKVYIIDEAHMITTGGWNAFLKTLENDTGYNTFIFASTELDKFPKTILSRCQKFSFKRLNEQELNELIELVKKNEQIVIEEEAQNLLIEYANGSARDLLSLMEQLLSYDAKKITTKHLEEALMLADLKNVFLLFTAIVEQQTVNAITLLDMFSLNGVSYYQLALELLDLSTNVLVYLQTQQLDLIKPSWRKYVVLVSFSTQQVFSFIQQLKETLENLKKSLNAYLFFKTFILTFNCVLPAVISLSVDQKNSTKNSPNNNFINESIKPITTVDPMELLKSEKNLASNKTSCKKENSLDSFIENKVSNEQAQAQQLKSMQGRIAQLDESWLKNSKLPNIRDISNTQDVTLELLGKNQNSPDQIHEKVLPNKTKGNKEIAKIQKQTKKISYSLEEETIKTVLNDHTIFYSFLSHDLDLVKNKEQCTVANKKIKELLGNTDHEFVLIHDAFSYVKKILVMNGHFMLVLSENEFNAQRFNALCNTKEFLQELKTCFNDYYIALALTKEEIKLHNKQVNNLTFDEQKYNKAIQALQTFVQDNDEDVEAWTKKMLFGE